MAAFTAKDVQTLREMTGVGMMDCKKALVETDGDIDQAVILLREKGLAAAAKKAGRIAAEGAVCAYVCDKSGVGALLELNSETDFAAKSEDFLALLRGVTQAVADSNPADLEALGNASFPSSDMTVTKAVQEKVLTIGENLQIRRFVRFADPVNVSYVHMGGKIGVLVNLKLSDNLKDNPAVVELGRDIAMQAAAMRPQWLKAEEVDAAAMEAEKEVLLAQTVAEGKPQAVAEKIVAGRMQKYYSEVCLLQQPFVKENKITVAQHVAAVAKELGGEIEVMQFARFETGEGLEKRSDNFADEVAKMVQ